ncbi:hypothetical protein [Pelotomaculum schinkii]|uniref:hypothetical protein n=1 Tax=Pelotomaculum schinkii TaxID=78350 RepID=UPI001FAA8F82|nr:hypothetical protein [Pelotomaculum schinkii]
MANSKTLSILSWMYHILVNPPKKDNLSGILNKQLVCFTKNLSIDKKNNVLYAFQSFHAHFLQKLTTGSGPYQNSERSEPDAACVDGFLSFLHIVGAFHLCANGKQHHNPAQSIFSLSLFDDAVAEL